ncbi:MAG: peptidyl-prolyl cis-trans isomerase [Candidatus Hinthialibacter antarcticus]|nr:peptidyl-prolyl cis-trans isomerase [Candidatus Hinthialibacter antarcticus]
MLEFLNAHKKNIMAATLWLVIPSFVLLYGYGQCAAPQQVQWVAKVNGEDVSTREWEFHQDDIRRRVEQQNPDAEIDTDMVREQALRETIVATLLRQIAKKWGVDTTNQEVVQNIQSTPAFQDENGNFNVAAYRTILQYNGINPVNYEEQQRDFMTLGKIRYLASSSGFQAASELGQSEEREKISMDIDYLAFEPTKYTDEVVVDDAELAAFFQENIEDYRVPEQRRASYVYFPASDYIQDATFFDAQLERYFNNNRQNYEVAEKVRVQYLTYKPENFADQTTASDEEVQAFFESNKGKYVTQARVKFRYIQEPLETYAASQDVSDEDVAAFYEQNIVRYQHGEEAKASHLLLRVDEDKTDESVQQRIAEITQEITNGDLTFAEAAEKYSEDPTAKQNKGDLGYFGRGVMVPAFDEAAFSLPIGDLSDPVKTQFGYHLLKVEDRKEEGTDSLESVSGEIRSTLQKQRAVEAMQEKAGSLVSLDTVQNEYEIQTSDWVERGGAIPGIPTTDGFYLTSAAFRNDENAPVVLAGNARTQNLYLVETLEREESRDMTLDEAREQVVQDVKEEKAGGIAQTAAEEDIDKIRTASSALETIAADRGLTLETSQPFGRSDNFIPGFGARPFALVGAAFGSQDGEVNGPFTTSTGTHIIRLLAREPARLPELDEVRRQVEADYTRDQSAQLARISASEFANNLFDAASNLASVAQEKGVTASETELISLNDPIGITASDPRLSQAIFDLGAVGESTYIPVESTSRPNPQSREEVLNGYYIFELMEIKEDYLPELAEAKDSVEADFRLKKAEAIALEEANKTLKAVQSAIASSEPVTATQAVDFADFVAEDDDAAAGRKAAHRGPYTMTGGGQVPGIGRSPVIIKTLLQMEPGQVSQTVTNYQFKMVEGERVQGPMSGAYILQLLGKETKEEVAPSPFAQFIEQRQQMAAASAWLEQVSAEATIEYNDELLNPISDDEETMDAEGEETAQAGAAS